MDVTGLLRKAWHILRHYRALWLFGAVLALVGANTIFLGPWPDPEDDTQWTKIKFSDSLTVRVPWGDFTVDLTAPGGARIITPEGASWQEFHALVDELDREVGIDLWPILVELGVIVAISILLGLFARYVAETALIRMVNDTEESGERPSLRDGLRRGLSVRAGRLFLLDLVVDVMSVTAFILVFGLAVAPVLLAVGSQEAILITAGLGTAGLLVVAVSLWLASRLILSLFLQPIRRACVLEHQGLLASIRQGVRMTKDHLKDVGLIWLIWMGIRLIWIPIALLLLILLAPVLLLMVLAGVALGGVPAVIVAAIASLFEAGVTPWIMGALAGLPILVVVTISPLLFVSGFVEVYTSSIWTLAYRDLRAKSPVQVPTSRRRTVSTPQPAN